MFLDDLFHLAENNTNARQEVLAGFTTWLTMVYIVAVNPQILSASGMDFQSVFVATCCAAAFGTLVMGLVANYPIALAPGMGLNAFFVYTVVLSMGLTWQTALGAVFWSGILFLLLSVSKVREQVINSMPSSIKVGAVIGIGLFLAVIGLEHASIIEQGTGTLMKLGNVHSLPVIFTTLGFVLITALHIRGKSWAVIAGILAVATAGWLFDDAAHFKGIISFALPSMAPTFLQLDLAVHFDVVFLTVVLSFLFVDLFDTSGTLVAVAKKGGFEDEAGNIPRVGRALLADSTASVVGALMGTSTTTSYIESNAGIAAGGRTGLTAIVVAVLFLLTLFFYPLAESIPVYATAPALVFVAILLVGTFSHFNDWDDFSESAPLITTAIMMPLTFSITDGLSAGCVIFVFIKLLTGRYREIGPTMIGLTIAFLLRYIFLVNL